MSPPSTPQALDAAQAKELEEASRLLQAGRALEAVVIGQKLVSQAAMAPDAHHLLALCQAKAGQVQVAEQSFLRALELAPGQRAAAQIVDELLERKTKSDFVIAGL